MRIFSLIAAAATLTCLLTGSTSAQQPSQAAAAAQPARPVIVLDIGHILRNHPTMKAEMEKIEASKAAVEKEMNAKREKILEEMKALGVQYVEGTPDYIRQEKKIAEADTEFRLELMRRRKEFDEATAVVLAQVHAQVTNVIKYACEQWGTSVVLRVSREKLDPKKPQTIELGMGQEVFYFNPSVDLTDWVLSSLQPTKPTATQSSGATATRPATGGAVQR